MTQNSEYQKPFNEQGRLNAEIITRKHYHNSVETATMANALQGRCECHHCGGKRDDLKRRVNRLMGRDFYEGV